MEGRASHKRARVEAPPSESRHERASALIGALLTPAPLPPPPEHVIPLPPAAPAQPPQPTWAPPQQLPQVVMHCAPFAPPPFAPPPFALPPFAPPHFAPPQAMPPRMVAPPPQILPPPPPPGT